MERWVNASVTVTEQEMEAIWPFPHFWYKNRFFFLSVSQGNGVVGDSLKWSQISEIGATKHKIMDCKKQNT